MKVSIKFLLIFLLVSFLDTVTVSCYSLSNKERKIAENSNIGLLNADAGNFRSRIQEHFNHANYLNNMDNESSLIATRERLNKFNEEQLRTSQQDKRSISEKTNIKSSINTNGKNKFSSLNTSGNNLRSNTITEFDSNISSEKNIKIKETIATDTNMNKRQLTSLEKNEKSTIVTAGHHTQPTMELRKHESSIRDNVALPASYLVRRTIDDLKLSDLLIITDVEGGLHALNRKNGDLIWSINATEFKPLINIEQPPAIDTRETLILEPYGDGNLYFFHATQGLQKIPATISQLIATSPVHMRAELVIDELGTTVQDEKIYTGARTSAMYIINIETGKIVSAYGKGTGNYDKNKFKNLNHDEDNESCPSDPSKLLVIGKSIYDLQISSKDGSIYNVTYGVWQPNSFDDHLSAENMISKDNIFVTPFRDKSLLAVDANLKVAKWISSDFPGIITSVFDVFQDNYSSETVLVAHPFGSIDSNDSEDSNIYLEQIENHSWAAFSSKNFASLVKGAPLSKYYTTETWKSPSIFQDENLFKTAITGVHTLRNNKYNVMNTNNKQMIKYNEPSLLLDPAPYEPITMKHTNDNDIALKKNNFQAIVRDDYDSSLFFGPQKLSLKYIIARVVYRVLESGVVLILSLIMLASMQKFQIIPSLNVLLGKLGLTFVNNIDNDSDNKEKNETKSVETNFTIANVKEKKSEIVEAVNDITTDNSAVVVEKNIATDSNDKTVEKSNDKVIKFEEPLEEIDPQGDSNSKDGNETQNKKKRRRGSRGGKKLKKKSENSDNNMILKSLTISDRVLGYGSCGTVVYQGTFQDRPIAVKRMLLDFCDLADREIKLLTESDDHPNVIRYYCSESSEKFLYIALELCDFNLQNLIDMKNHKIPARVSLKELNPIDLLYQIGSGIAYLHSLKIIHRDIKPQNILIATSKKANADSNTTEDNIRLLISDFGLCKKLEADQSSFRTNMENPAGTTGWRAPELLDSPHSRLDELSNSPAYNDSINESSITSTGSFYDPYSKHRLTKSVDIFSMGCVFFYILTNGQHPFGDRYMREANIIKGEYDFSLLKKTVHVKSTLFEVENLLTRMINSNPKERPTAQQVLKHPVFWPVSKKLMFLLKFSDRFEIEIKDPESKFIDKLTVTSNKIIKNKDWSTKFNKEFMDNLGKYRKYRFDRVVDLLRAFRNKYHHFMDMPQPLMKEMGPIPGGFYQYFISKFPNLLIELYLFIEEHMSNDEMMKEYFN